MGVANCSPEELETSFFHIFTHGIGFGRGYMGHKTIGHNVVGGKNG